MKYRAAVLAFLFVVGVFAADARGYLSLTDIRQAVAGIFFTESITAEELREAYVKAQAGEGKVKVLIVPGHDKKQWGTEYAGLREEVLNREVGVVLAALFAANPAYEVLLLRDGDGYLPAFETAFQEQKADIQKEVARKKKIMDDLVAAGSVNRADGVPHNSAALETALRLYAVNGWANAKGYHIVLHLHFNDHGGRPAGRAGEYSGFSVYFPDAQYSNARASRAVAEAIVAALGQKFSPSNLPKEGGGTGLVPDQELIAVGAYNTLDAAAALIEYGYIYEPGLHHPQRRGTLVRDYAQATYDGVEAFFTSPAR